MWVRVLREDGNVIGVGEFECIWIKLDVYVVHENVEKGW